LHIGAGKKRLTDTLQVVQPDIRQYESIIKKLKAKIRECGTLLKEKKTIPAIQIFRQRELTQKIEKLTADIEELKSEKVFLLNQLHCADDHGMTEIKQRVAAMESSLEKLSQQEARYADELNAALAQYDALRRQAADLDSTELDGARQAIRPDMEREVIEQLQNEYGKRYDSRKFRQSQADAATLLGEVQQQQSIRQKLRQRQEIQPKQNRQRQYRGKDYEL